MPSLRAPSYLQKVALLLTWTHLWASGNGRLQSGEGPFADPPAIEPKDALFMLSGFPRSRLSMEHGDRFDGYLVNNIGL